MFASVVVRSYRRPQAVCELVSVLVEQAYEPFEIVVVEQSEDPALHARLRELGGAKLLLLVRPPLGAPEARNEAIRHARGDILIFVDDDDVPIGQKWIADHLANYQDPGCMGIVGRLTADPETVPRPRFPRLVRRRALTHTFFKDTKTYAIGPLRKVGIDYLIGSNSSVRRSLIDRIGGWDEGVFFGEEQSFAFKFARGRRQEEYFAYDPRPVLWRRVDVSGGSDRRAGAGWVGRELLGRMLYYHVIVGHYFPRRFRLLYPLFLVRAAVQMFDWIWDGDNRGRGIWPRIGASLSVLWMLPVSAWKAGTCPSKVSRVSRIERGAGRARTLSRSTPNPDA